MSCDNFLNGSMKLTDFVSLISTKLPKFYNDQGDTKTLSVLYDLHVLVHCNEEFNFSDDTEQDDNVELELYLHTLWTAIVPKVEFIEGLFLV